MLHLLPAPVDASIWLAARATVPSPLGMACRVGAVGPVADSGQTSSRGAVGQAQDQTPVCCCGRLHVSVHCFGSFRKPLAPRLIRGGCVGPAEAEAGDQWGDQGGLALLPRLAPSGEFLSSLATSLCHPYLWFSAHFRSELSI